MNSPIGILGGTFNPIHLGHLRMAQEIGEGLDLAEIRLIPAGCPPHREKPGVSPQQRLEMARLAVQRNPLLRIDDREIFKETPCYTVETLREIRSEMGDDHPMQILIRCDKPSVVAAQVFAQDSVVEVKIHPDGLGLLVSTRNPDQFYSLLNRIVLDNEVSIEAIAPADENVHSVYQYLIGSNGRSTS